MIIDNDLNSLKRDNIFGLETTKTDIVDVENEVIEDIPLQSKSISLHDTILKFMAGTRGATPKWLAKKSKMQFKRVDKYLKTNSGLNYNEELALYITILEKVKRDLEFEKAQSVRMKALKETEKFNQFVMKDRNI